MKMVRERMQSWREEVDWEKKPTVMRTSKEIW